MNTALANPTLHPMLADSMPMFPSAAAEGAEFIDGLFWFITWVSIVFAVLIFVLMGLFLVKYRHRPGHKAEHSPHHNNQLEVAWSVIPLMILVPIFYWGFEGFIDSRNAPADAYEINVQAQKWAWAFKYPNGAVDSNLHVPKDVPVKLIMSSSDVLHSLFIPAFRVKMDCVPGKYTTLWFNATEATGESAEDAFDLFCTEYCGTGHSAMYAKVFVHETQADFEKWLKKASDIRNLGTPAEAGRKLYLSKGCSQCHSLEGVDNPANGGPAFNKYFGKEVSWTNGQTGPMDENYIRESILNPQAKIRSGYRPIMPTYQGQLDDEQIFAIIQFIKDLNGQTAENWAPREGEEAEGEEAEDGQADESAPAEDVDGGDEADMSDEAEADSEAEEAEVEADTSDGEGEQSEAA